MRPCRLNEKRAQIEPGRPPGLLAELRQRSEHSAQMRQVESYVRRTSLRNWLSPRQSSFSNDSVAAQIWGSVQ